MMGLTHATAVAIVSKMMEKGVERWSLIPKISMVSRCTTCAGLGLEMLHHGRECWQRHGFTRMAIGSGAARCVGS